MSVLKQFNVDLLASCDFTQYVKIPTHRHGHTLDLVIILASTTLNLITTSSFIVTSKRYPIFTNVNVRPNPLPPPTPFTYRRINASTTLSVLLTITQVLSSLTLPAACPTCSTHFSTLRSLHEQYAPLLVKINKTPRTALTPWITTEIFSLKISRRLERSYIASHFIFDQKLLGSATNHYHKFISAAKKSYCSSLVHSSTSNPHALWKTINKILHRTANRSLPTSSHRLPYLSYLPSTSLIKSQSYISTYKQTPLPLQIFLYHLHPSSSLSLLVPYVKSTIYYLNHLTHTVISILFPQLY